MLSFIPIAILAVACVAVYLFPIDERVHAANVARIAERMASIFAVSSVCRTTPPCCANHGDGLPSTHHARRRWDEQNAAGRAERAQEPRLHSGHVHGR